MASSLPPNTALTQLAPVPRRVAVIGAGIAGLTLARFLTERGVEVTVFEKEPHPGGRMSTYHQAGGTFDYGAQYFTARDPRFQHMVRTWVEQGHAAVWHGRFGTLKDGMVTPETAGPVRYVGTPCMSTVVQQLASRVDVRYGVQVTGVHREVDSWRLSTQAGDVLGPFEAVAAAVPAPEAISLLRRACKLAALQHRARMEPCWTVMVDFDTPVPLPLDGVFIQDSPLSWAARDNSKPGRPEGERWVLHATPDFSWEYLNEAPWFVASRLVEAFVLAARLEFQPRAAVAYRWLHARPSPEHFSGSFVDVKLGVGACGDWCAGSRVEAAFLSGMILAEQLALFLSERELD
jgi:renalase